MSIKNCPKCKKIFSPVGGSLICSECVKEEEKEFEKVRDYLRENRGANINIVSEETGVSTKKIFKYLREGRLEVTDGIGEILKCVKCGTSIKSGQYCRACSDKVSKNLSSVLITNDDRQPTAKMHIKRK
ncbi:MerR family transcriptional regulator [[Clostridium] colinum]|uniref:MerR family transcriptional regulator n=1 Tax=[Clostridium] colinum TaxID=36835 RepID=UPI0020250E5E|nr:MerR family transcriptional regulator [[Clostridium] colinum]